MEDIVVDGEPFEDALSDIQRKSKNYQDIRDTKAQLELNWESASTDSDEAFEDSLEDIECGTRDSNSDQSTIARG